MRVLVIGSSGLVGAAAAKRLRAEGHEVVPYDIDQGQDILDPEALAAAAQGCDALINASGARSGGAIPGHQTVTHTVTGNFNVLDAARKAGASRVVTFSSVNAIGVFRGEAKPDYLPIDDAHPIRPPTAYGQAKRMIEELCRTFTATTGIATIVFRPPAIVGPERHARMSALRAADPAAEWTPFWEYGAWLDTRDLAFAILAALTVPDPGHICGLIVADDTSSPVPARDLARKLLPDVPWRGPEPQDPSRVLVRDDVIRRALNWQPRYLWSHRGVDEP